MPQIGLDPDNIDVIITCVHCRSGLWDMRILKRDGVHPVSVEYLPINDSIPDFSPHRFNCPVCSKEFFERIANGEHRYRVIDRLTGTVRFI